MRTTKCLKCGAENNATDDMCKSCGAVLKSNISDEKKGDSAVKEYKNLSEYTLSLGKDKRVKTIHIITTILLILEIPTALILIGGGGGLTTIVSSVQAGYLEPSQVIIPAIRLIIPLVQMSGYIVMTIWLAVAYIRLNIDNVVKGE